MVLEIRNMSMSMVILGTLVFLLRWENSYLNAYSLNTSLCKQAVYFQIHCPQLYNYELITSKYQSTTGDALRPGSNQLLKFLHVDRTVAIYIIVLIGKEDHLLCLLT